MEKKKTTKAHKQATQRWESKAYWKTLVRFKVEDETRIRQAAGESLNGFIVNAVLRAVEAAGTHENAPAVNDKGGSENAPGTPTDGVKWYAFPADMIEEMQKYGDPAEMLFDGAMAMMAEYRAGLR